MRLSTITIYYVYELLILLFNLSGVFAAFKSIFACRLRWQVIWDICIVGPAAAFPISLVVLIIRQFILSYPLNPFVTVLAFCHQLKWEPLFLRNYYIVHFVRYENVVVKEIVPWEGGCIVIGCVEDNYFGCGVVSRCLYQVADQDAFPEDFCRPALHAVKRHDFLVFLVTINNLVVREFQSLVYKSVDC